MRASVVYNFGQLVNFSGKKSCCKFELYKLSSSFDYLHFDKVGESKLSEGKKDKNKTADDVDVQGGPIRDLEEEKFYYLQPGVK